MKIALVSPIYKANENNKFENYRPISACSYLFCKGTLEKLMYKRLIDFVHISDILNKHQYGSLGKNRSTGHAVIELVDKVTRAIDGLACSMTYQSQDSDWET